MLNYKIKNLVTSEEFAEWDEFVEESPTGTLFHKSYWLKASGCTFDIYALYKGEELFAGFPVVVQNILGIKRAKQPQLTPWLGPVYKQIKANYVTKISNWKKINEQLATYLKKNFDYVSLNFSPSIIDLQPYIWEDFSTKINYTYRLDLSNLEKIWDSMEGERRNDIRKAKKDGIIVNRTSDFNTTFKLIEKTFSRQNKIPYSKKRTYKINNILNSKKNCQSFISKNSEGYPISAIYVVWDNNTAYYLLGGYDSKYSHHGASALALWEAIQYSKNKLKLKTFDFEGSMIRSIEKFFRKFGGKITPYYSLMWGSKKGKLLFGRKKRLIVKKLLNKIFSK